MCRFIEYTYFSVCLRCKTCFVVVAGVQRDAVRGLSFVSWCRSDPVWATAVPLVLMVLSGGMNLLFVYIMANLSLLGVHACLTFDLAKPGSHIGDETDSLSESQLVHSVCVPFFGGKKLLKLMFVIWREDPVIHLCFVLYWTWFSLIDWSYLLLKYKN